MSAPFGGWVEFKRRDVKGEQKDQHVGVLVVTDLLDQLEILGKRQRAMHCDPVRIPEGAILGQLFDRSFAGCRCRHGYSSLL